MKFLELTAFGNNRKHYVALKSICDIDFQDKHTTIMFGNGHLLNVIESQYELENLIKNLDGVIADAFYSPFGDDAWDVAEFDEDGDNLPF